MSALFANHEVSDKEAADKQLVAILLASENVSAELEFTLIGKWVITIVSQCCFRDSSYDIVTNIKKNHL